MTDKYAVIGNPIAHSKSPLIHSMFAAQTCTGPGRRAGQDISYEAILAPLDGFAATVERLRKEGYKGCNVTVPFKFEAFKIATQLTERAQAAQAVNTLKFDDGTILGDNTDGAGLVRDIEHNFGISLQDKRVLLMGSGGAAYGVVLPLLAASSELTVVNRTPEKAQQLGAALAAQGQISVCGYAGLGKKTFDCIINATSSGLSNEMPPLPADIFAPGTLAYDMMYGRETPFMRFAREQGAQVADGLGMLVEQAAESFFLWRGVRPDTAPVIAALRNL
ncbi:MAG: shikimate dehydrogenase [Sideroxyarcus sp.]|nr:shikimate dehydrogenase [Sideroxyarcus sp.]